MVIEKKNLKKIVTKNTLNILHSLTDMTQRLKKFKWTQQKIRSQLKLI